MPESGEVLQGCFEAGSNSHAGLCETWEGVTNTTPSLSSAPTPACLWRRGHAALRAAEGAELARCGTFRLAGGAAFVRSVSSCKRGKDRRHLVGSSSCMALPSGFLMHPFAGQLAVNYRCSVASLDKTRSASAVRCETQNINSPSSRSLRLLEVGKC